MIAFIKPPEEATRSPRLRHVHRLLADTLLSRSGGSDSATPIVGWKAWLFVGWLAVAAMWGIGHTVSILLN